MKEKKVKSLSGVRLFETQWTVAYQAPLSMGFSRQEYWGGLLFPTPGKEIFQTQALNPGLHWDHWTQVNALPSEPPGKSKCDGMPLYDLKQDCF